MGRGSRGVEAMATRVVVCGVGVTAAGCKDKYISRR